MAITGVPIDLGVSNRSGTRFGPRALRTIERVGPYNHVLDCAPVFDLRGGGRRATCRSPAATTCIRATADIEAWIGAMVDRGRARRCRSAATIRSAIRSCARSARDRPVGLVHIDAHSDTGGPFDGARFNHGAPFRNAVLDGVLDPTRTIQIGLRGSSEYLYEFAADSGMTCIHAEEVASDRRRRR